MFENITENSFNEEGNEHMTSELCNGARENTVNPKKYPEYCRTIRIQGKMYVIKLFYLGIISSFM